LIFIFLSCFYNRFWSSCFYKHLSLIFLSSLFDIMLCSLSFCNFFKQTFLEAVIFIMFNNLFNTVTVRLIYICQNKPIFPILQMTTKQCILGEQSILGSKWKGGFFTIFMEDQVFANLLTIYHHCSPTSFTNYVFMLFFLWRILRSSIVCLSFN